MAPSSWRGSNRFSSRCGRKHTGSGMTPSVCSHRPKAFNPRNQQLQVAKGENGCVRGPRKRGRVSADERLPGAQVVIAGRRGDVVEVNALAEELLKVLL